jgi:alcohol dehydrogenase
MAKAESSSTVRYRPSGRLRRAYRLMSPAAATAGRIALERDARSRLWRLTDAVLDRVVERRRPTRERMRALTAGPGGRLGWRVVPVPPLPGPKAALVRPVAIATCDMDRPLALGATPFPLPLHLGHECVGEVLAVGDDVRTVRVGQRVVVPFQVSCGDCSACTLGLTANCTAVPPISMYGFGLGGGHWGGAFSERLAVPYADAMLVRALISRRCST